MVTKNIFQPLTKLKNKATPCICLHYTIYVQQIFSRIEEEGIKKFWMACCVNVVEVSYIITWKSSIYR